MGDPSYLIALLKDLVLNWDCLPAHRQKAILDYLNKYYRGGFFGTEPLERLPETFKQLMELFHETKLYGYLVPDLNDILSEIQQAFPETGYAMFIAYGHPVVFIFNPAARIYKIMPAKAAWPDVHDYVYAFNADSDEEEEEEEQQNEDEEQQADDKDGSTVRQDDKKEEGEQEKTTTEGGKEELLLAGSAKRKRTDLEDTAESKEQEKLKRVINRFKEEVVDPFQNLPAGENPVMFLRRRGFQDEELTSRHEYEMMYRSLGLDPYARRR